MSDSLVSTSEIATLTALPFRTIDHWCRTGLLEPIQKAHGPGSRRGFSLREAAKAYVVGHLRQRGVSLQKIRQMMAQDWLSDDLGFIVHSSSSTGNIRFSYGALAEEFRTKLAELRGVKQLELETD